MQDKLTQNEMNDKLSTICAAASKRRAPEPDAKTIEDLIRAGADFSELFIRNKFIIEWAAKKNHIEIVKAILDSNYCTKDMLIDSLVLIAAAKMKCKEIAELIMASPKCTEEVLNAKENCGWNALSYADQNDEFTLAILSSPHCTEDVLKQKIDGVNNTLLHQSVREVLRLDVIKAILSSPSCTADVLNAKDGSDNTALHLLANAHNRFASMEIYGVEGRNAMDFYFNNYAEVVKYITSSPRCTKDLLEAKNSRGKTALQLAFEQRTLSLDIITTLIKAGADFQSIMISGQAVVSFAQEILSSTALPEEKVGFVISNIESIVKNIAEIPAHTRYVELSK